MSGAKPYYFSAAETDAVFRMLDAEAPTLRPLAEKIMAPQELEQPYFSRHRIFCVQLISVMPPKVLHTAGSVDDPSDMKLLSVNIERLAQLVDAEPGLHIADMETAQDYAERIDGWTRDSPYGEFVISSFDDIPFYAEPDDAHRILIGVLRDATAGQIEAPSVQEVKDGFVRTKWLVENQRLLRRQLHIQHNGLIARYDNTVHDQIPCPPGKWWGKVDGRTVPIG